MWKTQTELVKLITHLQDFSRSSVQDSPKDLPLNGRNIFITNKETNTKGKQINTRHAKSEDGTTKRLGLKHLIGLTKRGVGTRNGQNGIW